MPSRQISRNVALTPKLDKFVKSKVRSGRYSSMSEVVREGLRLMEQRDEEHQAAIQDVRQKIEIGYKQALAGDTFDPDEVFAEIRGMSQARRRAAKGQR